LIFAVEFPDDNRIDNPNLIEHTLKLLPLQCPDQQPSIALRGRQLLDYKTTGVSGN
jgi:hypothetical protein